jgi:hypothetical protein
MNGASSPVDFDFRKRTVASDRYGCRTGIPGCVGPTGRFLGISFDAFGPNRTLVHSN